MSEQNDDRTTRESISAFLSDAGSSESVRSFLGDSASTDKPIRTRQLRATFRPVPTGDGSVVIGTDFTSASDPGFPGTRAFAPRSADRRAAGGTVGGEGIGLDQAPADSSSADTSARRDATVQAAIDRAIGKRAGESAGTRAAGGRVRGRRGPSGAKSVAVGTAGGRPKKEKSASARPALPAAIKKLVPKSDSSASASAPRVAPTEAQRADARRLFREIGQRFNENRKKSKTAAYAGYRHDLMDNMDTLIMGGAIDLKEVTTVITGLEQYTKETEAESTETPATILGRWLRMEPGEVGELEARGPVGEEEPGEVEEEESGEEDEENQPSEQQSI